MSRKKGLTDWYGIVQCWKKSGGGDTVKMAPQVAGMPVAKRIACSNDALYVVDGSGDVYVWKYDRAGKGKRRFARRTYTPWPISSRTSALGGKNLVRLCRHC